jgi:hypothetical protein
VGRFSELKNIVFRTFHTDSSVFIPRRSGTFHSASRRFGNERARCVASSLSTGELTIKWRIEMKRWLWVGVMATVIAMPALSGVARAGGTADYGYSIATLKDKGNLTQRDYQGNNSARLNFALPEQETGAYQGESCRYQCDSTGSITWHGGGY